MNPLWLACLELCLEAIDAGSLGIAAVITDGDAAIISRGRNQLFDSADSVNTIQNTLVSHAEVNAIAGLPMRFRRDKSISLYTTVEPCPMCLGAVAMSPIRQVVIASRDPYAGACAIARENPWMSRKKIRFEFESGQVERIFASLHVYSLLQRRDLPVDHPFYVTIQEQYPMVFESMISSRNGTELATAIRARDVRRVTELCSG